MIRVANPRQKYNSRKTVLHGIRFASKKEAEYYAQLLVMERAGLIERLKCQVKFELVPKTDKTRALSYIADFTYADKDGTYHVIDVKGYATYAYKIKKTLMYALRGILIEEK